MQDSVTVVGYPLGGDTISVTKGVVSRIEVSRYLWLCFYADIVVLILRTFSRLGMQVTSYAHGSSDLLGIQIDAAINPG